MNVMRILPLVLLSALVLAPAKSAAQASNERPPEGDGPYSRHPEAVEAIDRLKSPYCPGQMLETCPSGGGAALRDSVGRLADSGWTASEIVEWVVGNYGEQYRALPKAEGAGLLAWLMPPIGGLLGIGLLGFALRRLRRRKAEEGPLEPRDVSDEDERRLREALKQIELEEEVPFL